METQDTCDRYATITPQRCSETWSQSLFRAEHSGDPDSSVLVAKMESIGSAR